MLHRRAFAVVPKATGLPHKGKLHKKAKKAIIARERNDRGNPYSQCYKFPGMSDKTACTRGDELPHQCALTRNDSIFDGTDCRTGDIGHRCAMTGR